MDRVAATAEVERVAWEVGRVAAQVAVVRAAAAKEAGVTVGAMEAAAKMEAVIRAAVMEAVETATVATEGVMAAAQVAERAVAA